MTLGIAVVGAGVVGSRRAASAAEQSRLEVVADVDEGRAVGLAKLHGARHTTHWEVAVTDDAVDVVAVCTSNKFLAPIAIAALGAGKHVLCEKPMGRNAHEAAQIADAARRSGRVLKVGFTLRFHPAIRRARELCTQGAFGPLFLSARHTAMEDGLDMKRNGAAVRIWLAAENCWTKEFISLTYRDGSWVISRLSAQLCRAGIGRLRRSKTMPSCFSGAGMVRLPVCTLVGLCGRTDSLSRCWAGTDMAGSTA